MNNALTFHRRNIFEFNLLPVFKAYEECAQFQDIPTIEGIIDSYDLTVNWKLRELHETINPSEALLSVSHPWHYIPSLPSDVLKNMEELIGMKPNIETEELVNVLSCFSMSYLDHYDLVILNNFPIKEVW